MQDGMYIERFPPMASWARSTADSRWLRECVGEEAQRPGPVPLKAKRIGTTTASKFPVRLLSHCSPMNYLSCGQQFCFCGVFACLLLFDCLSGVIDIVSGVEILSRNEELQADARLHGVKNNTGVLTIKLGKLVFHR